MDHHRQRCGIRIGPRPPIGSIVPPELLPEVAPQTGESGICPPPIEGYYPFSITLEIWLFTITLLLGNFYGNFSHFYYPKLPKFLLKILP